ncbi:betaine/proline/choline family ABC transporter ATP-binding protein [Pseudohalocynthiibacter aestuariivivens]|nr:betaine/proline/choline family ABC transporter ATP-binding protein [Pseudohalocynthiibacter aestuariivivens]QIE45204.1 betaine/proline/choline family ABC transporter ATP-binding protein [Pseudohalocynthiibacter aestuariivivens]
MQKDTSASCTTSAQQAGQAKLSCRNLWKVFGDDAVSTLAAAKAASLEGKITQIRDAGQICGVADVSFDVHEGEIFVVMGLSGSGKSTMLRCLSSLVSPTAGEIIYEGRNLLDMSKTDLIDLRRHKMGMVFQSFGLLPHLSVIENVAFPLKIQGVSATERLGKAREYITLVGLDGREYAMPDELSGGQQQRVGIARSLAVGPDLWFLDEPFSALDPLIRRQMQDEFMRLQSKLNKTIVFVTHDFLEALKIADRIAIMRDGQMVQIGTPAEIVLNPADDYVAEFASDVPLTRVLTASDVMTTGSANEAHISIPSGTTLEDILDSHDFSDGDIAVADANGNTIGQVTAGSIVSAMHEGVSRARHAEEASVS